MNTFKPTRVNLCSPVREACQKAGISTVRLIGALNAALGEIKLRSQEEKQGKGSLTKESYKTTMSLSMKFQGRKTIPLEFDAWHSAVERADKIASFNIELPSRFKDWLASFVTEPEVPEVPETETPETPEVPENEPATV